MNRLIHDITTGETVLCDEWGNVIERGNIEKVFQLSIDIDGDLEVIGRQKMLYGVYKGEKVTYSPQSKCFIVGALYVCSLSIARKAIEVFIKRKQRGMTKAEETK